MTTYQLARRLNVNQSRVVKMESAAVDRSITLKTLERAAEALECHLVFALVPKHSLEATIREQAEYVAKQQLRYLSHSMELEDQAVDASTIDEEVQALTQVLLEGSEKKLWEMDK